MNAFLSVLPEPKSTNKDFDTAECLRTLLAVRQLLLTLEARIAVAGEPPLLRARRIIDSVAAHFGFPPAAILEGDRSEHLAWARHVAMYLARNTTPLSWHELGSVFHKDPKTIYHGVNRVKDQISIDPESKALVDAFLSQLHTE